MGANFLDLSGEEAEPDSAAAVIIPFPYEGGISYMKGTARAPEAIIRASAHLELYDEELGAETFRMGIATAPAVQVPPDGDTMLEAAAAAVRNGLNSGKFIVLLGGDHSITSGFVRAVSENYPRFSVIQIDAHADLRDVYQGCRLSHACTMARIREMTPHTLQIGIRSLSTAEAERIDRERLQVCTMRQYRNGQFDLGGALRALPDPVFLTLDVDVFDWSVIAGTGTPEPGGMTWDEGLTLLRAIFSTRRVIGLDCVELIPSDANSVFAAAKLIYKMLGYWRVTCNPAAAKMF